MSHPLRVDVVKANGKRPPEKFDPGKLHVSIVQTCLSVHTPDAQAESIAEHVVLGVIDWCNNRHEITSQDIRRIAGTILAKHHTDAAYLYQQQQTMI